MKAIRFHEFGSSEVLRYEDLDRPVPGTGQVLVRVAATSFNPVDDHIRAGVLAEMIPITLPYVPGIDLAGTVAELGADVTGLEVGDRVVAMLPLDSMRRRRRVRARPGRVPGPGAPDDRAGRRRGAAADRPGGLADGVRARRAEARSDRPGQRGGGRGRQPRGAASPSTRERT